MAAGTDRNPSAPSVFTGRIDRRLSVVFGSLFGLVLVVGSISLYLLGSVLLKSEEIARESEQVHVAERLHRSLQGLLFAVQQARLQGVTAPDSVRRAYAADLAWLLDLYRTAGADAQSVQAIQQIVSETERLADKVAGSVPMGAPATSVRDPADAKQLDDVQARIQAFTERVAARHAATESGQVEQANRKLRLTIAVNIAFVVLGTLLLMGSHRYFHRAIASPLRQLTERASEIARGDRAGTVPVTSTDEIGRLNDAFNRMGAQLREHEERARGLVVLQERERLARELHDSLAQDLAFLRLKLIEADRSLGPSISTETKSLVRETFAIVDGAYENLREAILGLHALDPGTRGGLIAALGEYLEAFRRLRKIPVELEVSDAGALALPPHAEAQLMRIISEALTNVAKHAGASKAVVRMEPVGDMARITIEDDGKGFAVDTASEGLHFGIKSMTDRARAAGGTLVIDSAPGQGTRVVVRLPLAPAGADRR